MGSEREQPTPGPGARRSQPPLGSWRQRCKEAIDNLIAAGILVVAGAGDDWSGMGSCSTLTSPGDYQEVLTVGTVSPGRCPARLSLMVHRTGPSPVDEGTFPTSWRRVIRFCSSYPGGYYQFWSSSGLATPHVTGLIALMWSANPACRGQVEDTLQIIQDIAIPLTGQPGLNCGGDYTTGPNNDWGYGTIDALAAVQAAVAYGGTSGTLQGTVTDAASHNPIPGADILATLSPTQTFQAFTGSTGEYSLDVVAGTYL